MAYRIVMSSIDSEMVRLPAYHGSMCRYVSRRCTREAQLVLRYAAGPPKRRLSNKFGMPAYGF